MDRKMNELKELSVIITSHTTPTSPLALVALNSIEGFGERLMKAEMQTVFYKVWSEMYDSSLSKTNAQSAEVRLSQRAVENQIVQLTQTVLSMRQEMMATARQNAELQSQVDVLSRRPAPFVYGPIRPAAELPHRRVLPATFGLRGGMQIFIKTLTGKTITIDDISGMRIVLELKQLIRLKLHFIFTQNSDFYLIFGGHRLADHRTLNSYNIVSGSTVWMVMRLRGGMVAGPLCNKQSNPEP